MYTPVITDPRVFVLLTTTSHLSPPVYIATVTIATVTIATVTSIILQDVTRGFKVTIGCKVITKVTITGIRYIEVTWCMEFTVVTMATVSIATTYMVMDKAHSLLAVSVLKDLIKDIPGASEHIFLMVLYCYRSFKPLKKTLYMNCINQCIRPRFE